MGICADDTQRKLAQVSAIETTGQSVVSMHPEAKALRYKLGADRARLKKIQSMQQKAAVKAELLPDYLPYVEGIMAADQAEPDEIVMQLLVWCFDAGAMEKFETIVRYVLKHDASASMPGGFKQPTVSWIAESVAKWTLEQLGSQKGISADWLLFVIWLESQTADCDMHDQVRAKLSRVCGELLETENPEKALQHYQTAIAFDKHIRIKKKIKALEQRLASVDNESPSPQGQAVAGNNVGIDLSHPPSVSGSPPLDSE